MSGAARLLVETRAATQDGKIGHASEVTATNLGLGILDVFTKVRPEKPKLGRCMNRWVERK